MNKSGFQGGHRHPLSIERIEAGNRIADHEQTVRKPIEVLVALAAITVRELLLERPSIEVRTDCQVFEYLVADDSTGEAGTVSGIRYRNGATNEGADGEVDGGVDGGVDGEVDGGTDEETMEADLVVDATGRTSKTPDWLERNGYTPPPVDEVYVDVQYCTIEITRPPDDRRTFVRPTDPPGKRAIGMVPCEDDRWILTCAGVHGAQPPREVEQFLPWIEELPAPVIGDVVADTEVLSTAVASHALPSFNCTITSGRAMA